MGGGDLNSKKSWHPNTLKNQERVWKAEQAVVEEKKRIMELQKERAEEWDREGLNALANRSTVPGQQSDTRLNWMYDKPDKKAQAEDYLLGKAVDGCVEGPSHVEIDAIPVVARRVAGVSLLGAGGDTQVDLIRKMREDPLVLVQERERAARAALLNNPLHRRRITELLRQEQATKKTKKSKKSKRNEKNLDDALAAKLTALGGEGGVDLAALLASDDSSDDSSDESVVKKKAKKKKMKKSKDEKLKKKKKEKKSKKKERSDSDASGSSSDDNYKHKMNKEKLRPVNRVASSTKTCDNVGDYDRHQKRTGERSQGYSGDGRRNISQDRDKRDLRSKRNAEYSSDEDERHTSKFGDRNRDTRKSSFHNRRETKERKEESHRASGENVERPKRKLDRSGSPARKRKDNSSDDDATIERETSKTHRRRRSGSDGGRERAARLAEMARAGAEHEARRGQRVAAQRAAAPRAAPRAAGPAPRALRLPDSLESRIHSNRHYIQRGERHMNEHFAKR